MLRILPFVIFGLAIVVAVVALGRVLNAPRQTVDHSLPDSGGQSLPETFKKYSYILLIVLMFGVVTGWLGGM